MAAGAAGITTGDGAYRRTNPATRHSIEGHSTSPATGHEATTDRPWNADRSCGLVPAAKRGRDTPHRIRALRHGTTARPTSRFRMGCVSRTEGVRPAELT